MFRVLRLPRRLRPVVLFGYEISLFLVVPLAAAAFFNEPAEDDARVAQWWRHAVIAQAPAPAQCGSIQSSTAVAVINAHQGRCQAIVVCGAERERNM